MYAVIMAGGSGTRFWPLSRAATPKQLLPLAGGERTMIQATVERLDGLCAPEQVLVVTNQRLVDAIRRQLPQLPGESIVGEPCRRDTRAVHRLGGRHHSRRRPASDNAGHAFGPRDFAHRRVPAHVAAGSGPGGGAAHSDCHHRHSPHLSGRVVWLRGARPGAGRKRGRL